MATIIDKPEALSLSGNMNKFVLGASKVVSFVLKKGTTVLVEQSYNPDSKGKITIDVKDIVENQLSYKLDVEQAVYNQSDLAADFTAIIDDVNYSFRVVKAGIAHFSDTPGNWLKTHFLTWQPKVKKVSYYSPEWLTYYAVESCQIKLQATFPDKTTRLYTLANPVGGAVTTCNLQYAVIAGLLGYRYPSYYEVWVEVSGKRVTELQYYTFTDVLSEDEQWFLFENSLGGLDCFRAFGVNNLNSEQEHKIAELAGERLEYNIDTARKYTKNTGFLDDYSRHWLLDFFPSKKKFIHESFAIRRIVATESKVSYASNELPSSYTFTYQYAEISPYLNLIRNEQELPDKLVVPDMDSPDFIFPPRLAESPRIELGEGVLIPAFDAHDPKPTVTTFGAIHQTIKNSVVKELSELWDSSVGGGGGGDSIYHIKENDLTEPSDENAFTALRTLKEIKKGISSFDDRYLRKDIDDTAHGEITFDRKIGSSIFLDGYDGRGWEITDPGAVMIDSARVRSDVFLAGKFGSPSFASGFAGWGVEIDIPRAAGTFDFLTVRKSMKVYELVYSQIYGLGGSVIVSDLNKILYVETCQGFYRCYMDSMDGTMRMNLRKDDIVRMQRSSGINIRYFYGEILKVTSDYFDLRIIDGEDAPEMGDVVFRFGNKTDKNRQGIIYLTSSDDQAPYIDILDGITDASMFEKVKVRIGNVSGIRTRSGIQLNGYRIYAQGAVFEDTDIYLEDGTTVEQKFVIMNGKFESEIEGIRNDMSVVSGNILKNSSFGENTGYWNSEDDVSIFNVGGGFLWFNANFYSDKRKIADIYRDGSKNVLRILGTTISQRNSLFKFDGEKKAGTYSFAFFYKVKRAGRLMVGFPGQDLYAEEQLTVSDNYQKFSKIGQWDGKGDFKITFTGEILIYGVSLFNDALADAQIQLQTQITQNAEEIALKASKDYVDAETGQIYIHYDSKFSVTAEQISGVSTKIDNINHTIQTAGWITRYDGNYWWASKEMENGQTIISYINQTPGNTTIASNRINLYGAVTFSSFNSSLQQSFNNIDNTANTAYRNANSALSAIDSLPGWSKKNSILAAMEAETLIIGGYINSQYIKVNTIEATVGYIGGFQITNRNLKWSQSDYFGNGSRTIRLGCAENSGGAVDISFNAATSGAFGVKSVGSAPGGAAIYASSKSYQTYPKIGMTYAGYFDGDVDVLGDSISNACASQEFRAITGRNSNGTYTYLRGISFGSNYDLDDVRFTVRNGLIVALHKDNGSIIIQG